MVKLKSKEKKKRGSLADFFAASAARFWPRIEAQAMLVSPN